MFANRLTILISNVCIPSPFTEVFVQSNFQEYIHLLSRPDTHFGMRKVLEPRAECSTAIFVFMMWDGKKQKLNLSSFHKPHADWLQAKGFHTGQLLYYEFTHFLTSPERYFSLSIWSRPSLKHKCTTVPVVGLFYLMRTTALWQIGSVLISQTSWR